MFRHCPSLAIGICARLAGTLATLFEMELAPAAPVPDSGKSRASGVGCKITAGILVFRSQRGERRVVLRPEESGSQIARSGVLSRESQACTAIA